MATMTNCPACGKLNDSRLDNCVYCGAHMKASAPSKAAQTRSMKPCPNCGAMVSDTDIICRSCNTNLLTKQKVGQGQPVAQPADNNRQLLMAGGILAAIAVIAGLIGIVYYFNMRDPVVRAERMLAQQDIIGAQGELEKRLVSAPDDERALFLLGRIYFQQDNYSGAADAFERASNVNPNNTDAMLWALLSMARFPSVEVVTRMESLMQRAVQFNPNDPEMSVLLGLVRGVSGNVNGSVEALQTALREFSGDDDIRVALAVGQALQGNNVQAESTLQQVNNTALSSDKAAAGAYISILRGRTQNALTDLQSATRDASTAKDAALLFELGRLYAAEGRFAEAEAALKRSLELQPGHTPSLYLQAIALQAQGVYQEAQGIAEMLARGSSPESGAGAVLAAQIHLDLQNPDGARQLMDLARQKNAGGVEYLTTQGRLQVQDREFRSARLTFDRAIQSNPRYAPAYLESGLLHVRLNDLPSGIKHLERYLDLTRGAGVRTKNADVTALVEQLKQAAGQPAVGS